MSSYPSGALIAGQYEIVGRPLIGGMGVVYLCFDHDEQRPVALKTVRPAFLSSRTAREQFLQEGTTWVNLGSHPNVVRCYKVIQVGSENEIYLVLEFVAKEENRYDASLRSYLTQRQVIPIEQALLFGLQIARGMAYATTIVPGLVHRDLKPENLLVGRDRLVSLNVDRLRVTDFGLAVALQQSFEENQIDSPIPGKHVAFMPKIAGTPEYMAPEQWMDTQIDERADIYAFGCIVIEMLTGQMPVSAEPRTACRQLHEDGLPLQIAHKQPRRIATFFEGCLAVDRAQRYSTWDVVIEKLGNVYSEITGAELPKPETIPIIKQTERIAMGWSWNAIGLSYLELGKPRHSLLHFKRATEVGRTEAHRQLEVVPLNHQGLAYADLSDFTRAIDCHERGLQLAREINDQREQANNLNSLGKIFSRLGKLQQATGLLQNALEIFEAIEDWEGAGNTLTDLGDIYRRFGDLQKADGLHRRALEIFDQLGMEIGKAHTLNSLGLVYHERDDPQRAMSCYEQALAIFQRSAIREGEGHVLNNLGIITRQNDVGRSVEFLKKALDIYREIGNQLYESGTLINLAVTLRIEDAQQALRFCDLGLTIIREFGDSKTLAQAHYVRSMIHKHLGDHNTALADLDKAIELDHAVPNLYASRARLCFSLGMNEKALADCTYLINRDTQQDAIQNIGYDARQTLRQSALLYLRSETLNHLMRFEEALEDLNSAIEMESTEAAFYIARGNNYHGLKRYDDALADFNHAISLAPENRFAFGNRADTYSALGLYDQAMADLSQAIQFNHNFPAAYFKRAMLFVDLGRYKEAAADYTQAIELGTPDAMIYWFRARALEQIGLTEEALDDYTRAIELRPMLEIAYWERALINFDAKRYDEALVDLNHIISKLSNLNIQNQKSSGFFVQTVWEGMPISVKGSMGEEKLMRAALMTRALTFIALKEAENAQVDIERYLSLDPDNVEMRIRLGTINMERESYHAAISNFSTVVQKDPTNVEAFYKRGIAYSSLHELSASLTDFSKTVDLDPKHAEAYVNRGAIRAQLEQDDEAIEDFIQAIALDNTLYFAHYNLATILIGRGALQEALFYYNAAAKHGDVASATQAERLRQFVYESALTALGRTESFAEVRLLTEEYPFVTNSEFRNIIREIAENSAPTDDVPIWRKRLAWLDDVLLERNRRGADDARSYDELAETSSIVRMFPSDPVAVYRRGMIYISLKRYIDAINDLTKAIQLKPDFVLALFNRSAILYVMDRFQEALSDLNKVIEIDPNFVRAYINRGSIFLAIDRYEEALVEFTHVIETSPEQAMVAIAYVNRGIVYEAQEDYQSALKDHLDGVNIDPDFAQAYMHVANLLVKQGRLQESLPFIERANRLGQVGSAELGAWVRQELRKDVVEASSSQNLASIKVPLNQTELAEADKLMTEAQRLNGLSDLEKLERAIEFADQAYSIYRRHSHPNAAKALALVNTIHAKLRTSS